MAALGEIGIEGEAAEPKIEELVDRIIGHEDRALTICDEAVSVTSAIQHGLRRAQTVSVDVWRCVTVIGENAPVRTQRHEAAHIVIERVKKSESFLGFMGEALALLAHPQVADADLGRILSQKLGRFDAELGLVLDRIDPPSRENNQTVDQEARDLTEYAIRHLEVAVALELRLLSEERPQGAEGDRRLGEQDLRRALHRADNVVTGVLSGINSPTTLAQRIAGAPTIVEVERNVQSEHDNQVNTGTLDANFEE